MDLVATPRNSGTHGIGIALEHKAVSGALASDPYGTLALEESCSGSPSKTRKDQRRIDIRRPIRQTTATQRNRPE